MGQGEFDNSGPTDVLAQALSKEEHPARVRGIGFGVPQSQCFGKSKRRKQPSEDMKAVLAVVEALQEQVNIMSQELRELKKGRKDQPVEDEIVLSDKDSCTILPEVIWIRLP